MKLKQIIQPYLHSVFPIFIWDRQSNEDLAKLAIHNKYANTFYSNK